MDRGVWQAISHGVARVGSDLATKPPPLWLYSWIITSNQVLLVFRLSWYPQKNNPTYFGGNLFFFLYNRSDYYSHSTFLDFFWLLLFYFTKPPFIWGFLFFFFFAIGYNFLFTAFAFTGLLDTIRQHSKKKLRGGGRETTTWISTNILQNPFF